MFKKLLEGFRKEDFTLLAARKHAELMGEIGRKKYEINMLHYALREAADLASITSPDPLIRTPEYWIELVKNKYGFKDPEEINCKEK